MFLCRHTSFTFPIIFYYHFTRGELRCADVSLFTIIYISYYLQGLVAFSEHGLMIRWWSLGSVWWEKLSRNLVPVQCTKVIFVPPGEGFSPNTSRSSIMGSVLGNDREANSPVIFCLR